MRKFGSQSLTVGPQGSAGRRDAAPRSTVPPRRFERDLSQMPGVLPLDAEDFGHFSFRGDAPLSAVQDRMADWREDARREEESE